MPMCHVIVHHQRDPIFVGVFKPKQSRCFPKFYVCREPECLFIAANVPYFETARDSQRLVVAWKWKNIGTVAWPASATLLCLSSRGAEMRVRIPTVWASKISDWISIELDIAALPIYERELYFVSFPRIRPASTFMFLFFSGSKCPISTKLSKRNNRTRGDCKGVSEPKYPC